MSAPLSVTPDQAALAVEVALLAAGCGVLGWLLCLPSGRAWRARPAGLAAWNVTLVDFLLLGWVVLVLGFVGQYLLQLTIGPKLAKVPDGATLQLVLYGSTFHLAAMVAWLGGCIVLRTRGGPPEPPAPRGSPTDSSLGWLGGGLLTFAAVLPLATGSALGWEQLLDWMGLPTERQELVDRFIQTQSIPLLASMIGLALLVAPISEELVFRAGLFRFLRTRAPRWLAFTVSAGLFALLHGNWASALPLFVLGLVFAAAYERTGCLAVPMIAHACFNLNTLLLVLSGAGR